MEPVGRLTMSGELYEGNYPEWAQHMSADLEELYASPESNSTFFSFPADPREFVLDDVSPSILSRLPELPAVKATHDEFGRWSTLGLAKELVSIHQLTVHIAGTTGVCKASIEIFVGRVSSLYCPSLKSVTTYLCLLPRLL